MRWLNELAAVWDDLFGLGFTALILMLIAAVVSLVWYTWPALAPRNWRLPSLRRARRREVTATAEPVAVPQPLEPDEPEPAADELPQLPAQVLRNLADQFAAEGRFAEAIRERLRAMIRELVDRQVIESRPGWTVTELAGAAAIARPEVEPPLKQATSTFSLVWYGQRPATAEHDATMREQSDRLHRVLAGERR